MMKGLLIMASALLMIFCSCCRMEPVGILEDAEACMSEHPEIALALLEDIDTTTVKGNRTIAKFRLLQAMAFDLNHIDTTNVSIVAPAIEFYQKKGTPRERMLSLYHLGCIQRNKHDYTSAISSFHKALKAAPPDEYKYLGLIYYNLSSAYSRCRDTDAELTNMKMSLSNFEKSGEYDYSLPVLYKLAVAYQNNNEYEDADSLYNALYDSIELLGSMALDDISDREESHRHREWAILALSAAILLIAFAAGLYVRKTFKAKTDAGLAVSERENAALREMYSAISRNRFRDGKEFEGMTDDELEILADDAFDGTVSKIRADFPCYDKDDITFICGMLVGMDTSAMAMRFGISKDNVRKRKSRIKAKITGKDCGNAPLYRILFG